MKLTDKELEFLYHELSAAHENAHIALQTSENDDGRIAMFDNILDKIADEQIRRQGRREAMAGKTHPSKWDRFIEGSAMDALMKKINADRAA